MRVLFVLGPCQPAFGVFEDQWTVQEESRADPFIEDNCVVTKVFRILEGSEMSVYLVNPMWDKRLLPLREYARRWKPIANEAGPNTKTPRGMRSSLLSSNTSRLEGFSGMSTGALWWWW